MSFILNVRQLKAPKAVFQKRTASKLLGLSAVALPEIRIILSNYVRVLPAYSFTTY